MKSTSTIVTEVVSNFNYQLLERNLLKKKQKNWENFPSEKNSRRSRWFTVFKQQLLLEAITFIKIQRGTRLKLETKFFLKLRATKNQKKLIRIAVPSEHQSTKKSKQLDTSLETFLDTSISSSKTNTLILMGQ